MALAATFGLTENPGLPIGGATGQALVKSSPESFDVAWGTIVAGTSSVSNADGTLTISPTTGAVVASLAAGYTIPTSRTISTASPLSGGGDLSADRALSIADAIADGATKGAAAFAAADFNSAAGVISLDYTNGQTASGSAKGFLASADWTTFNNKVSASRTISTTSPITGGGDLSANRTFAWDFSIANTWTGQQTFNTSAPIFGTMTAGSVLFAGALGVLSQDNSGLYYNSTDKLLGIGRIPGAGFGLDITLTGTGTTGFRLTNTTTNTGSQIQNTLVNNSGNNAYFGITASGFTAFAPLNGGRAFWISNGVDAVYGAQSSHNIIFTQGSVETARITSGQRFGFFTADPTLGGVVNSRFTICDSDGTTVLCFANTSNVPRFAMNINSDGGYLIYDYAGGGFNAGIRQVAGKLGLGGTSPSEMLHFPEGGNIQAGTSTGTKIGTGTTQKFGFWNTAPIAQPANTTAIDTLLSNLGLRASGGVSNFSSALSTPFAAKTANYTVTATDSVLTGDCTGGTITFTLPSASGISGRQYTFKRIDGSANSVIIDGNGAETIDGAATYTLTTQYQSVTLVSNGTNWWIT